jgi:hypothetical protein
VPPDFLPHLLETAWESVENPSGSGANQDPGAEARTLATSPDPTLLEALTEAALGALDEALHGAGRDRAAAFRLLSGDAWLTYACEASLEEETPVEALEALLARTGGRFG